jgi:hypothetical protein
MEQSVFFDSQIIISVSDGVIHAAAWKSPRETGRKIQNIGFLSRPSWKL